MHRLQQLDTELDAARKRGKEIDTLLKGTPALQHARGEYARAEAEMKAADVAPGGAPHLNPRMLSLGGPPR